MSVELQVRFGGICVAPFAVCRSRVRSLSLSTHTCARAAQMVPHEHMNDRIHTGNTTFECKAFGQCIIERRFETLSMWLAARVYRVLIE